MNKPTTIPPRRTFLFLALASAGLLSIDIVRPASASDLLVPNVTGLYSVAVARIIRPSNAGEVSKAVRTWPGKAAVGGGRYSMGGQTAVRDGLHLDMRAMNSLVWFKPEARCIRVQAGMRWRDMQEIIDQRNLSIKTMQSYSNFTVGGSVSVNAHGRYVGNGPLCNSVGALQIVLADGSIIEADTVQNKDIFSAAIGGYGAIGIITEIELDLAENIRIERSVQIVPLEQYPDFFKSRIAADSANVMHNADLVPPLFNAPISVTWRATSKPLTESKRLIPREQTYRTEQNLIWALTELPGGQKLQSSVVRPLLLDKPIVKWRNHEASRDVAELEPLTRKISTFALQEYFIPIRNFVSFSRGMARILRQHDVEALNVSIRHSPADKISMLPWAKEDVFAFVLYYKQRTYRTAREEVGNWTRALIDLALANEGRFYLPYQLHATKQQFNRAYPDAEQLRKIKNIVDSKNKFSNEMWNKYL
jgi:FAD/FMN-containing dehydrogenase